MCEKKKKNWLINKIPPKWMQVIDEAKNDKIPSMGVSKKKIG